MSRDCPECGASLMPTADGGYACIQCGESWDEGDAPPATGTPLDVDGTAFGEVRLYVPDPRRGHKERPINFDPDAARRLAEAIEQAATDAERRSQEER